MKNKKITYSLIAVGVLLTIGASAYLGSGNIFKGSLNNNSNLAQILLKSPSDGLQVNYNGNEATSFQWEVGNFNPSNEYKGVEVQLNCSNEDYPSNGANQTTGWNGWGTNVDRTSFNLNKNNFNEKNVNVSFNKNIFCDWRISYYGQPGKTLNSLENRKIQFIMSDLKTTVQTNNNKKRPSPSIVPKIESSFQLKYISPNAGTLFKGIPSSINFSWDNPVKNGTLLNLDKMGAGGIVENSRGFLVSGNSAELVLNKYLSEGSTYCWWLNDAVTSGHPCFTIEAAKNSTRSSLTTPTLLSPSNNVDPDPTGQYCDGNKCLPYRFSWSDVGASSYTLYITNTGIGECPDYIRTTSNNYYDVNFYDLKCLSYKWKVTANKSGSNPSTSNENDFYFDRY